ncbi:MAG: hypothetical protein JWP04_1777 [Belnapia sp.]|nr:hypothetical protein [Belnapia sp.]
MAAQHGPGHRGRWAMDSFVYSTLDARDRATRQWDPGLAEIRPPGPRLGRALHYAARENWRSAQAVLHHALEDPAERRQAHYLLWEVCQVLGEPEVAVANLAEALRQQPLTSRYSPQPRRRVLALAAPGDFQANLPLGALLDAVDIELHTLWLTDVEAVLRDPIAWCGPLPDFDCIFITIAEDVRHRRLLEAADLLAAALGGPVINRGSRIAALSRLGVAELLQGLPDAVVPAQRLLARAALDDAAALAWPSIIRPEESHAGRGLARLADPAALRSYLAGNATTHYYLAPFIDYRSADGYWRKYRIIFVDGRPFPYHMAIHDDWTIWYYNSRMDLDPWKRREEAAFLADLAAVFPAPALRALEAIGARSGLDYVGLDCGLMPDGRLLVFEVETGMIVHGWDRPSLYPYKRASVQAIITAVEAMLDRRVADWPGG